MNDNRPAAILALIGGLLMLLSPSGGINFSFDGFPSFTKQPGSWVLLIEDPGARSKEMVSIQADTEYWKGLEARKLKYRFYPVGSSDADSYRDAAMKAGLPALVILSPGGKPLTVQKAPTTTSGIDSQVKRFTGL
jgi:hypothetical protein